ncbi:MAG TPA: ATP-grasp domain-containing protein [Vicinamibacterales bacterium]|nr:ATP-grasp domain-containing protein [Vicinamibacterales bacterium]
MTEDRQVVIAGVSTRAAAESAALAGYRVKAIDAFGDLDQHTGVRSISLGRGFSARAAARTAAGTPGDVFVYLANFENHPKAVAALAAAGTLWGNPAEVVQRVRHPVLVAEALRRRGFRVPEVRLEDSADNGDTSDSNRRWLIKPRASGGGQRIQFWTPDTAVPPRCYLQEFIDGTVGSVVFVAADGRVALLGVSRQLVGEQSFGAEGFQYCGNILGPAGDAQSVTSDVELVREARRLAEAIADEFHLVGVNGIDFIAREKALFVVEVNPRWCASMELVERAYGVSVFSAHAAACESQALPAFDLAHARRDAGAFGRAVVYARRDITVGDTRAWLADSRQIRDVPHPGERISRGRPVCTVFAGGRDAAAVHRQLAAQADCVYGQLEAWDRSLRNQVG